MQRPLPAGAGRSVPRRFPAGAFVITPDGFGSIAPRAGAVVHGVLWRLTPRDLAAINAYESLDSGLYLRRTAAGAARQAARAGARLHRAAAGRGQAAAGLHDGGDRGGARMEFAGPLRSLAQALVAVGMERCAMEGYRRSRMSGDAQAGRDMTHRHVIIRGRVQGVGFRAWTEHVALRTQSRPAGFATGVTARSRRYSPAKRLRSRPCWRPVAAGLRARASTRSMSNETVAAICPTPFRWAGDFWFCRRCEDRSQTITIVTLAGSGRTRYPLGNSGPV